MRNTLPGPLPVLFSRAEDNADGCNLYEGAVGIQQNKELSIRNQLAAARTAQNTYQTARTTKLGAVAALQDADKTVTALLTVARDVLKPYLGNTWSQSWVDAGFVNNSLKLPSMLGGRLALLAALQAYFTAHADRAVEALGVTALNLGDQYDNMSSAQAGVNACLADVGLKKSTRDTEAKKLRMKMRGLITELKQLLPGDDARWLAFGLNPPSAVGLPDVPEGLELVGSMPDHLFVTFESAALADRYRIYRKITGVDSDYVLAKTVTETEADLNTFTTGQVVKVRVSAVNDAGESPKSEPVEQTVS